MTTYYFSMALSAEKCKRYYAGEVFYVVVTEDGGKTIQLPVSRFRPFMALHGLRGRFRLILDSGNKFVRLEKLN